MFCTILISIYLFLYCPAALYLYYTILKPFRHEYYDRKDLPEKYLPFKRSDIKNWSKIEIYLGALILAPIRIPLVLFHMALFNILVFIASKGTNLESPWTLRFRRMMPLLTIVAKLTVFFCGFMSVKHTLKKYSQFDPDYKQSEEDRVRRPALIVSNHVSWYDIFLYISKFMTSFLSKESIKHYPVAGMAATSLKSVFVSRESEKSREQVSNAIHYRINGIDKGLYFPPLLIFPEGTTSNGKYLLSFKRGAFEPLQPVKICCLRYADRRFNLGFNITLFELTMLSMVQLSNQVEMIEFEGVYNPSHLHLEQYPEEKRWEVYAEKVKDIMSKCLNIPKSNSGYREWSTYYDYLEKNPIK